MKVNKVYVLKSGDKFVSIDSASGGYPYLTDFWYAHKFHSIQSAKNYSRGEYEIYECDEIVTRFIFDDTVDYERELQALNVKYGRNG